MYMHFVVISVFHRNVTITRYNVGEHTIGIAFHDHIISMLITWGCGMGIRIDGDLTVKNIILLPLTHHMVNQNWACTFWNICIAAVCSVRVVQLATDDICFLVWDAALTDWAPSAIDENLHCTFIFVPNNSYLGSLFLYRTLNNTLYICKSKINVTSIHKLLKKMLLYKVSTCVSIVTSNNSFLNL